MNTTVDETPWEVSVFAALLNVRWAHRVNTSANNSGLVTALDGAPETALGDILLRNNDRLFLLELKASWQRAYTEIKKPIFKRYLELYQQTNRCDQSTQFDELMLLSVKAHHLVYWEDVEQIGDEIVRGTISFSPYALFVLDHVIGEDSPNVDIRTRHALAQLIGGSKQLVEAAPIVGIFDKSVKSASGDLLNGKDVRVSELGLKKKNFMKFVQMLSGIEGGGDFSLKLIAFSPESGFVRRISSLNEAIQLAEDWGADSAWSRPAGPRMKARAGEPRLVGKMPLTCEVRNPVPPEDYRAADVETTKKRSP